MEKIMYISYGYGGYHAAVLLRELHRLPMKNIRRLFRLLFRAWAYGWREENEVSVQTAELFLDDVIRISEEEARAAARAYADGWRDIEYLRRDPKQDRNTLAAVRQENQRLTKALKQAEGIHKRWVRICEMFKEEKQNVSE